MTCKKTWYIVATTTEMKTTIEIHILIVIENAFPISSETSTIQFIYRMSLLLLPLNHLQNRGLETLTPVKINLININLTLTNSIDVFFHY